MTLAPLAIVEDRTPAQLAADGDAPPDTPAVFSASKTAMLDHCLYPFSGLATLRDREVAGRPWGNAAHTVLCAIRSHETCDYVKIANDNGLGPTGPDELARIGEAFKTIKGVPGTAMAEVAFAYDPRTRRGRVLGYNIGRAYREHGLLPHEWAGTADLVWMAPDGSGRPVILDLKTGWSGWTEAHRPQLLTLALMAERAFAPDGGDSVPGAIIGTLSLRDDEVRDIQWIEVADYELLAHEDFLLEKMEAAQTAAANPGPWCTELFCNAVDDCPVAGRVKELALIPAEHLTVKLKGPIETVEEASANVLLVDAVKAWVKQRESDLRVWADEHDGIQTANGRWGKQPGTPRLHQITVTDDARRALEETFGKEVADAMVSHTTSQEAIKDACRKAGLKIKATTDATMARLKLVKAAEYRTSEGSYGFDKK